MHTLKRTKLVCKIAATILFGSFLCAKAPCAEENAAADKSAEVAVKKTADASKLECSIFVSLQGSNRDWWFRIPSNSVPHIAEIRKIFLEQNFSIFPFISNAKTHSDTDHFSLIYSIYITRPDGETRPLIENSLFRGKKSDFSVILACPDVVSGALEKDFPLGKYKLTMNVYDEISKQSASAENYFDAAEWIDPLPMADEKLVDGFLKNFYYQPSPETLHSIFFSKHLNLEQKKAPNGLNYIYLGFLRSAFKANPFLLKKTCDSFSSAKNLDRAKIIMLLAILGEPLLAEDKLREYEIEYQKNMRKHFPLDPYENWDPVMGAAQIDMLWGEFFAEGNYAPIRRIMDALSLNSELAEMERIIAQNRKPATKKEWQNFMLGMLNKAALSTLAKNAFTFDLVRQYCEWAIENKDIPPSSILKLSPIIKEINNIEEEAKTAEKLLLESAATKPEKTKQN